LDRGNREREVASQFIAFASLEGALSLEDCEKGLSVLLERLEDLALDVHDVLPLLSTFSARLISDECVSPSFLNRLDVNDRDLAALVSEHAQYLLDQNDSAEALSRCWRGDRKRNSFSEHEHKRSDDVKA